MFKYKLLYGDCLKRMKELEDNSVDMILADPPYFKVVNKKFDNIFKEEDDFIEWQKKWILESVRILKETGSFYIFGSIKNNALIKIKIWLDDLLIYRNWITWAKPTRMNSGKLNFVNCREEILYYVKSKEFTFENPRGIPYQSTGFTKKEFTSFLMKDKPPYDPLKIKQLNKALKNQAIKGNWKCKNTSMNIFNVNGKYRKNVLTNIGDKTTGDNKKRHIAEKPVFLMEMLIRASSKRKDIIIDPFMGSGTVGVACANLNRKYIGIELDKKYYKIAKVRIKKALLKKRLF